MSVEQELIQRSGSKCELCGSEDGLSGMEVSPSDGTANQSILVCSVCKGQIENPDTIDENHWHCLNDSMWSEVDAVKVVAYRMLKKVNAQDLLDMMYLEDNIKEWAENEEKLMKPKDSNGTILQAGDSVTVIKDLEVKGAGFTAKRGTVVKNIHLSTDEEHIEGKVNGVKIVLKTCFLKKC
jgi:protein PhnA